MAIQIKQISTNSFVKLLLFAALFHLVIIIDIVWASRSLIIIIRHTLHLMFAVRLWLNDDDETIEVAIRSNRCLFESISHYHLKELWIRLVDCQHYNIVLCGAVRSLVISFHYHQVILLVSASNYLFQFAQRLVYLGIQNVEIR